MAKINIDLTTNVDISAREGDTFQLDLGVTKEDGTDFNFFTTEHLMFIVYGVDGAPVLLLNSGSLPYYLVSSYSSGTVSSYMLQKARAISNLIGCDINLFTFTGYGNSMIPRYLNSVSGLSNEVANVRQIDGGIRLVIQSHAFNLPQGSYSYELKIASDLRDILSGSIYSSTSVVDSYFKNSSTWMEGKFTVNKN